MSYNNAKLVSTTYTGNTTIPAQRGREYFLIQPTSLPITIQFGEGSGAVTLPVGSYYEPYIAPSTEITIVTTGSFVVVTNV
jgi:hypothetical protein